MRSRSWTTSWPHDRGAAARRPRAPGQHADGRRLAGAVVAEKAEDLAFARREADVVDGAHLAVVLGEVLDLDADAAVGRGHRPAPAASPSASWRLLLASVQTRGWGGKARRGSPRAASRAARPSPRRSRTRPASAPSRSSSSPCTVRATSRHCGSCSRMRLAALYPSTPRHLQVEKDRVGAERRGEPHGLGAVRRPADDLDAGHEAEKLAELLLARGRCRLPRGSAESAPDASAITAGLPDRRTGD